MASRAVEAQASRMRSAVAAKRTRVVLELHAALTEENPVDTGFSRASWTPSLNAPATTVGGSREAVSAASAAAGAAVVAASRDPSAKAYVTNNAHYIGKINNRGRHAGFVQRAIKRALAAAAASGDVVDVSTSGVR